MLLIIIIIVINNYIIITCCYYYYQDPSQPHPTTTEDLQGFWDMMYLQISDIETKFKNLSVMEENNWEENIVEE